MLSRSLLYHSILISLNRHFVRPTPGFAANQVSKETCISSVDTIIALIREFRAQQGLGHSPVLVVYSAVMASSGIFFTQDSSALALQSDRRLSFILKALEECSPTHNLAKEARIKLQANMNARLAAASEEQILETATDSRADQLSEPVETTSMGWMDGSMFDLGAFDLGSFGSLDHMTFRGIGADPSQWLAASSTEFTADPALLQNLMSSEPSSGFQATSYGYPSTMQGFDSQNCHDTAQ
jgi:hypothetical protein